MQSFLLRNCP